MNRHHQREFVSRVWRTLCLLLWASAPCVGCEYAIQPTGSLAVINDIEWGGGGDEMVALYVTASGDAYEDHEQLHGVPLEFGEEIIFAWMEPGEWDVIAVDDNGLYYATYNASVYAEAVTTVSISQQQYSETLTTEAGGTPVSAVTGDLLVTHNIDWNDGMPTPIIVELYVSETSNEVWDTEYLSGTELVFGESVALPDTREGSYDLLVRDNGGNSYLQMATEVIAGYTTEVAFTTDNFTELAEFR